MALGPLGSAAAAEVEVADAYGAEVLERAAAVATRALAAALERIRHGASTRDLEAAAVQAAGVAGATHAHLDVRIAPAGPLETRSMPVPTHLHKTALVLLRIHGVADVAFAAARTTVVGFDTLPDDLEAAQMALRGLVTGTSAAVPGATIASVAAAIRGVVPQGCAATVERLAGSSTLGHPPCRCSAVGLSGESRARRRRPATRPPISAASGHPLAADEVLYVEVTVAAAPAHQGARMGDMVKVAAGGGVPLTTLAARLWL